MGKRTFKNNPPAVVPAKNNEVAAPKATTKKVKLGGQIVELDFAGQILAKTTMKGFEAAADEISGIKAETKKAVKRVDDIDSFTSELNRRLERLEEAYGIQGDSGEVKEAWEAKFSDGTSKLYTSQALVPEGIKASKVLVNFKYGRPYEKLTAPETLRYQEGLISAKLAQKAASRCTTYHVGAAHVVQGTDGPVYFAERSIAKQAAGKAGSVFSATYVHYYDGLPCEACTEEEIDSM